MPKPRLTRTGRHEFVEAKSAMFFIHRLFAGEMFVDCDLIGKFVLLNAARVARDLRGAGSIFFDLFGAIGCQTCTQGCLRFGVFRINNSPPFLCMLFF